jgi:hypothetical protein
MEREGAPIATAGLPSLYDPDYSFERTTHVRPPRIDRNPSSKDPRFRAAAMAGFSRDQFVDGARVLGVGGRDDHDRAALDPGSRFPAMVRRESSPCLPGARSRAAPPRLPGLFLNRGLTENVRHHRCHRNGIRGDTHIVLPRLALPVARRMKLRQPKLKMVVISHGVGVRELCVSKTPFSGFQRNVTLLHSDRLVCGAQFPLFNVADFKGIRTG